jgi:hypothetical protein
MFEEIAVWNRVDAKQAIRYIGFRNMEKGTVWIAFGNYVGVRDGRNLSAEEIIAADGTLTPFLDDLPSSPEAWKPNLAEAIAYFVANNPDT